MGKQGRMKRIYSEGADTVQVRDDGTYEMYGRDHDGLLVRAVVPKGTAPAALRAIADDMDPPAKKAPATKKKAAKKTLVPPSE